MLKVLLQAFQSAKILKLWQYGIAVRDKIQKEREICHKVLLQGQPNHVTRSSSSYPSPRSSAQEEFHQIRNSNLRMRITMVMMRVINRQCHFASLLSSRNQYWCLLTNSECDLARKDAVLSLRRPHPVFTLVLKMMIIILKPLLNISNII